MSRDRFKQVFSQVLDGLSHLHETERLLHRDIKPENILVGKHSGTVKIADLQNVGKINDPEVMLPTRGGAAYTAPELLNALLNREKSQCNLATEFYALGATMYYTLTGEKYNQFTLTTHEEGSELVLPQGTIKIALLNQGVRVEQVDIIEEDQKLEQKLAKIPRSYRQLLYSCLNQRHRTYDLVYGSVFEHHRKLTDYLLGMGPSITQFPISILSQEIMNNYFKKTKINIIITIFTCHNPIPNNKKDKAKTLARIIQNIALCKRTKTQIILWPEDKYSKLDMLSFITTLKGSTNQAK